MKKLLMGGKSIFIGENSMEYIKELDGKKIFIATGGKSVFSNGTMEKIKSILENAKKEYIIFSGIKKNPDTEMVLKGLEVMKDFNPDTILAVGGGSPIDAAKIMVLLFEYPEINFENILQIDMPQERKKTTFIAVPTTSGTGTEVTKSAVVTFKKDNLKIGLKTDAFIPDIAILDGSLTMTMPDNIVAETGLDAMTHAIECYINNNLDDYSEALAKGAVAGLFKYLPVSYKEKTLESRQKVHNYQSIAGMAFANVGLGMSHGIAHSFGGKYDLGHGLLNGTLLPHVLKYNSKDPVVKEKLKVLSNAIGKDDIIEEIVKLNELLGIPKKLGDLGIKKEDFEKDFDELLSNSLKGSTVTNPIKISKEEMEILLRSIF